MIYSTFVCPYCFDIIVFDEDVKKLFENGPYMNKPCPSCNRKISISSILSSLKDIKDEYYLNEDVKSTIDRIRSDKDLVKKANSCGCP